MSQHVSAYASESVEPLVIYDSFNRCFLPRDGVSALGAIGTFLLFISVLVNAVFSNFLSFELILPKLEPLPKFGKFSSFTTCTLRLLKFKFRA